MKGQLLCIGVCADQRCDVRDGFDGRITERNGWIWDLDDFDNHFTPFC